MLSFNICYYLLFLVLLTIVLFCCSIVMLLYVVSCTSITIRCMSIGNNLFASEVG